MSNQNNPTLIFILGATSSGKTDVAFELAKRINGEIISCDSMQVYKNMDIITQAPLQKITSEIKHYLVREILPDEEYNASTFSKKAIVHIEEILQKGKNPLFSGGTGLYVKALVDGLFDAPHKDEDLRKELQERAEEKGNEVLFAELQMIDPVTADKLHINDTRRIIRALEVYELTGRPISEKKSEARGVKDLYNCLMFGLELPREVLYSRINANVEKMFQEGLVDEVRKILEGKLSKTAKKALGIKEVSAFLSGENTLEEAKEELKKNTRRYAKRQLTWFRGDNRIKWINANRPVIEIVDEIFATLNS